MALKDTKRHEENYRHPTFEYVERILGVDVMLAKADDVLHWGATNSLWIFPMGTSCCAIELMAAAAARLDMDRIGTIVRGSPRQCDVMVIAGTITVKMAPRVKKLWDQMPEPKWAIAMGSCAISGDFYRDIYSVVPGVDTFMPVDVYVPGCPPGPDALVDGVKKLQEIIRARRSGRAPPREPRPETAKQIRPAIRRLCDEDRDPAITAAQMEAVLKMDKGGAEHRGAREAGARAEATDHAGPFKGPSPDASSRAEPTGFEGPFKGPSSDASSRAEPTGFEGPFKGPSSDASLRAEPTDHAGPFKGPA